MHSSGLQHDLVIDINSKTVHYGTADIEALNLIINTEYYLSITHVQSKLIVRENPLHMQPHGHSGNSISSR